MLLCCAVYVAYLLDSSIRRLSYLSCCRFQFGSNEEMANVPETIADLISTTESFPYRRRSHERNVMLMKMVRAAGFTVPQQLRVRTS